MEMVSDGAFNRERRDVLVACSLLLFNTRPDEGSGRRPRSENRPATVDLQALLDRAGEVRFPPGRFVVDSPLMVRSDTRLILTPETYLIAAPIPWVDRGVLDVVNVSNVRIEGGVIDGNAPLNPTGRVFGLRIMRSTQISIIRVSLGHCPGSDSAGTLGGDGIYVGEASNGITVRQCRLVANVRQGISLTWANDVLIANNEITGTSGSNPGAAIDLEGDGKGTDFRVTNVVISGNTCRANGRGIQIADKSDGVQIVNNVISDTRSYAMLFGRCHAVTATGNRIRSTPTVVGSETVRVEGAQSVRFIGNTIESDGREAGRDGMRLVQGRDITIANNIITGTPRAGIMVGYVAAGGDLTAVTIRDNILTDCGAASDGAAIEFSGNRQSAHFPTDVHVSGNRITHSRVNARAISVPDWIPPEARKSYDIRHIRSGNAPTDRAQSSGPPAE